MEIKEKIKMPTLSDMRKVASDNSIEKELVEILQKTIDINNPSQWNIGVVFKILKDGKQIFAEKCVKCGHVHLSAETYERVDHKCPSCGSTISGLIYGGCCSVGFDLNYCSLSMWSSYNYYSRQLTTSPIIIKKVGDIYVCASILFELSSKKEKDALFQENTANNFLTDSLKLFAKVEKVLYFSPNLGFRATNGDRSFMSPSSSRNIGLLYSLYNKSIIQDQNKDAEEFIETIKIKANELGLSITDDSFKDFGRLVLSYNDALKTQKSSKKSVSQEIDTNKLLGELPKEKILTTVLDQYSGLFPTVVTEKNGRYIKYSIGCVCENIIVDEMVLKDLSDYYHENVEKICPCCGRNISTIINSNPRKAYKVALKYWQQFEGGVALRMSTVTISLNENGSKVTISEPFEYKRVLFTPKKPILYFYTDVDKDKILEEKQWTKGSITDIGYNVWSDELTLCVNSDEELIEIINNSFFKTTGIMQAWGLGEFSDYSIEKKGSVYRGSYLLQWYKKPYLEMFMKCGLTNIVEYLYSADVQSQFKDKKTVREALDITKNAFKILRTKNLQFTDVKTLRSLSKLQPNFSAEMWDNFKEKKVDPYSFVLACERTETTPQRMFEYLDSCYDNQCIERCQTLTIFMDYYRMAKEIGFNIADSHIKFPNSLKKEHDKASFAFKVVEDELKKKRFIENAKENEKYVFEDKNFKIIVPQTPDEVIREGQLQHHCVASYVSRIESGDTCVVFLRKKTDLDTPFYTCEIFMEKLYQVKGFSNKYPNKKEEPELIEFIEKWAAAKNLEVEYMKH